MKWSLILFACVLAGENDLPGPPAKSPDTPPVHRKSPCQRKRALHRQADANPILLPKEIIHKTPTPVTKEMVDKDDPSSQPPVVPTHIKISDAKLNANRGSAGQLAGSDKMIKQECDFIDDIKQKTPVIVTKFYNDISVVQETKNTTHWECELAEAPSDAIFHTDLNRCHPSLQGQCSEWADGGYFQLTGFHGFKGDAVNWTREAISSQDWSIFDTPVYPSIAVAPISSNTSPYGHVYIVASIASNGKLCTGTPPF
ncbi:hypothetical protein DSO57_1007935 [Entomophthora muscae]|uniref:Uncharacterized protein n=1 Tax=Entomophthora muscae TaxID=34485 RepID=A0ACC2U5I4_9FUNG|nr:hypothetical protein DSO57_1007935 [Entomophthora muscae]